MSATFGPVAEQHVNTSRRKLEEILVKVATRTLMQMKMKIMKIKVKMSMMMMKKVSDDDGYLVMKVIL